MIVEKWLSEFKAEPGLNDNLLNLVQASLSGKSSFMGTQWTKIQIQMKDL